MDKLQGVNKNHLSLVKGGSASSSSTGSSSAASAGKAGSTTAKADAAVLSSPATVVNITSSPSTQRTNSSEGPIRNFDDAKKLASSIAERVTGEEHGGLTADSVRPTLEK